jgi:microcystin-dependent protein
MATVTASYNWVSGETVTPTKLNSTAAPTVVVADNEVTTAKILDANVTTAKIADGNITLAKLVTAVQQALIPAGAVQAFAMNSAPSGWLAADGTAVSRSTYAALFAAISTTYGVGDGSTTFALPDLRGYFVRGSGTNSDGTAAGTFGVKQADDLKSHTHGVTDPGHVHIFTTYRNTADVSQGGAIQGFANFNTGSGSVTQAQNNTTGISINSTGGTETRPKNIAMLYCIKF